MAKQAIDIALKKANLEIKDIDCVINAGCLVPQIIPSTSSLLLAEYNVNEKDCFDVDCTCLSFLKALEIAIYMMNANKYNRVLIFSSELALYELKKENEKTFSMFGDGAVCFILEKSNQNESSSNNFELLSSLFQAFPDGGLYSNCKAGGTLTHPKYFEYNQDNYYFEMDKPKTLQNCI